MGKGCCGEVFLQSRWCGVGLVTSVHHSSSLIENGWCPNACLLHEMLPYKEHELEVYGGEGGKDCGKRECWLIGQ